MNPIRPDPKRKYPPPQCYMDENGEWWEAPGKPWTLNFNELPALENADFSAVEQTIKGQGQ